MVNDALFFLDVVHIVWCDIWLCFGEYVYLWSISFKTWWFYENHQGQGCDPTSQCTVSRRRVQHFVCHQTAIYHNFEYDFHSPKMGYVSSQGSSLGRVFFFWGGGFVILNWINFVEHISHVRSAQQDLFRLGISMRRIGPMSETEKMWCDLHMEGTWRRLFFGGWFTVHRLWW